MKKILTLSVFLGALTIGAGPLIAHHGTRISYDREHPITLKGTVTELFWANPHVSVFVDVKDKNGKVVNWALEGGAIRSFARSGLNRSTLLGKEVTVVVSPSRAGAPVGQLEKLTLPDGTQYGQQGQ